MTENVTSINQNGNGEEERITGSVGEIFGLQEGRINALRRENEALREQMQKEPVKLEDVLNRLQPPEDYEPTYQIRPLKSTDSKKIRQMIRKFIKNEDLQDLVSGSAKPEDLLGVVDFFFDELEDELLPWAISLTGKTGEVWDEEKEKNVPEWDLEPASADTDVLNDLKNHPDFLGALRSGASLILTSRKLFGR